MYQNNIFAWVSEGKIADQKKRMRVKIVGQVRPKKSGKMMKNIYLSTIVTDVKQPFPQLLLLSGIQIGSGKLGLKTGGESGK